MAEKVFGGGEEGRIGEIRINKIEVLFIVVGKVWLRIRGRSCRRGSRSTHIIL